MVNVVTICERVLVRLSKMDYERKGGCSEERLIFPNTFPSESRIKKGISEKQFLEFSRISEQELRFLFVDEFLKDSNNGYYSVETPTENKYRFGKTNEDIKIDSSGRSASIDMCVFEKSNDNSKYKRKLNIEFKNENATGKSISKDILKLVHEKENGVFVLLLKNTDNGTLKKVLDKFSASFDSHKEKWRGEKNKFIQLIILSLEAETNKNKTAFLKYRKVLKKDLVTIKSNIGDEWI